MRARLVGHRAGDQGLARAGRAVEQHALGRVDAQALEDLGVAQGQLDHLADAPGLTAQAADILVGDRPALTFCALLALLALLARDADDRRGSDQGRAGRAGLDDAEALGAGAEQVDPHAVAGDHWDAVEQLGEVAGLGRHLAGPHAIGGGQHDRLRRLGAHPLDAHALIEADARVHAQDAVDLDQPLAALLGVGRHGPRHGGALAGDLNDVADTHAELVEVLWVKAHQAPADVFRQGLGHPECNARFLWHTDYLLREAPQRLRRLYAGGVFCAVTA